MKIALRATLRHAVRLIVYGSICVVLTLIVVLAHYLENRPDLDVWHKADLDEEFTADSAVGNFAEYLKLEDRLFRQLDERVYQQTGPVGDDRINRYKRGSLSDPQRWPQNWNRSFEMPAGGPGDQPPASVLLIHGLSDSPYSVRAMAQSLQRAGLHTLALRVPGHGTAPSGLVTVRWPDMAAAVKLAMAHLVAQNGDRPIYIVGYSNGAALAVHYTLATLDDPTLPPVDRLVLLSPEIGVTSAAFLAVWQARLGHLLGLEKFAWNDILPEYDPFKYGSFAINAGDLSYRLTLEIQRRIDVLTEAGKIQAMPPILAFSSVVDATVLAPALVDNLLNRLPGGGHELVLFDINYTAGIEHIMAWSPAELTAALKREAHPTFALTLVTNESPDSSTVVARQWNASHQPRPDEYLGLAWPRNIYSLSHDALPFEPGDPLYGGEPDEASPGIALGNLAFRGEKGVLHVSPAAMLRLRWNPFYPYMEQRTLEFLQLAD